MRLKDLYRKTTGLFRPDAAEIEGTIEELRVLRDGGRERWLLRLDARRDALFLFEPTAISPLRRKGQRVRIGYAPEPNHAEHLRAEWIAAA
jgi:hypothetical protein